MSYTILNNVLKKRKTHQKALIKETSTVFEKGQYHQCHRCKKSIDNQTIAYHDYKCVHCGTLIRLKAFDRLFMLVDSNSFIERGKGYITLNPFFDNTYDDKLKIAKKNATLDDAFIYGYATIDSEPCVIGIFDSTFMMASMGSVVGEKVAKAIEYAYFKKVPLILVIASGGARMQEGMYSLMQMAKTSAALNLLDSAGLLYISVLTDPTMGGVSASFALLGDIVLAEPNALIGFAGPRVIEQTIKETLPEGFQKSEFLLEKGFIDQIVERKYLKETLGKLLRLHA